jgi:hypothetical protein
MKKSAFTLIALALAFNSSAQTPSSIPGLQLWLDAQDGGTINTSGGFVTQWEDKSGNGFHATQADALRQPTVGAGAINGNTGIHFDSVGGTDANNDGMAINTGLSIGRPYTAYVVDQYWGGVQGRTLQGATNNWLLGKWGGSSAHFTGDWVGVVGGTVPAGTNAPVASEGLGTANYSQFNINGRNIGGNTAVTSPGNIQLGFSAGGTFDETSQADVGEVIVFNRALADNERNAMAQYLGSQWGLPAYQNHNATRTSAFTGADAGEGLDFQGTFLAAVNARGAGGFSIGNASFTNDTGVITSENEIGNWGANAPIGFSGSVDDTALNTLMESIRWTATDGVGMETINASVGGLTVGNTYKLQLMFGDAIAGNNRHFAVDINGDRVIGDFAQDAHVGDATTSNLGVAVVHEFVATSTTLDVVLAGTALTTPGNDLNPLLQGLTVEDRGVTGIVTTGTFANAAALDFVGSFVHAINLNGPGGAIVGNATFTADNAAGMLLGAENNIPTWILPDYGATSDDDALESVMQSIRWTATNSEEEQLSLDLAVNPGGMYRLQLLFDDDGTARGFDVMFEDILVLNNWQAGDGLLNTGSFISYEFTATDDMFNIVLDGFSTGFGDKNPILNAATLELIPEPSHTLLTVFGLAILASRRRRS